MSVHEAAARTAPTRGGRITLALAVGTTIAGGIPVFLLGALFTQIQRETAAPAWVLGAAVAAYWAAAAVVSMLSGRVISLIGVRAANFLTLAVAAVSLLGSAVLVPEWSFLLVWAVVGGAANGLGHPSSNSLIHARVSPTKLATAFGIKQSAVPFSAFIAGLTVPAIGLTVGWPWAFAAASVLTVVLIVLLKVYGPPKAKRGTVKRPPHVRLSGSLVRYLLLVASVTTLGAGAAGAVSSYAVTAAVGRGVDDAWAGVLLSIGSLVGATSRIVSGRLADRTLGRYALVTASGMLAIGGLGVLLMSLDVEWTFILGLILALGIGWGWPGLTHFVVSHVAGPATPSATGIVQTGSYIGSGGGPLVFGLFFSFMGDGSLWLFVGAVQLVAACIAFWLSRRTPPATPVSPDAAAVPAVPASR
ncbi:MAG: hypothetical protein JWR01_1857 [Subtercola sp.]|nr:hypothetical protein [Subtercola sp.]